MLSALKNPCKNVGLTSVRITAAPRLLQVSSLQGWKNGGWTKIPLTALDHEIN